MKIRFNNFKLLLVFLLILVITGCNRTDDGRGIQSTTIIDVLLANNLTSFSAALEATNLVTTLQGEGPYTVFAPSNDSFSTFLNSEGIDLENMTASEIVTVRNVLLNHVLADTYRSSIQFVGAGSGYETTEADGPGGNNISLFFNVENDIIKINGLYAVIDADNSASNGVLHIVNDVIGIPNIVSMASADSNFIDLITALTANGQPNFVATLSLPNGINPTPFTVFAPINSAFQSLLDSNTDWNTIEDIPTELLTSVLEHHIIAETNLTSANFIDGASSTTLEGDIITFNLPGNDGNPAKITDGSGNTNIDIIVVDIQTSNGVIHAIETVLIPNTTN